MGNRKRSSLCGRVKNTSIHRYIGDRVNQYGRPRFWTAVYTIKNEINRLFRTLHAYHKTSQRHILLTIESLEQCLHKCRERERKEGQHKYNVEIKETIHKVVMPGLCAFKKERKKNIVMKKYFTVNNFSLFFVRVNISKCIYKWFEVYHKDLDHEEWTRCIVLYSEEQSPAFHSSSCLLQQQGPTETCNGKCYHISIIHWSCILFYFKIPFCYWWNLSVWKNTQKTIQHPKIDTEINEFPNQKEEQRHQSPHDKTLPLLLQKQQVKGNGYAATTISKHNLNSPSCLIRIIYMEFHQIRVNIDFVE